MIFAKRLFVVLGMCIFLQPLQSQETYWAVSLIEILAHRGTALVDFPEGVATVGYIQSDGGGAAYLFLTRDHALINDISSALYLSGDTEDKRIFPMRCDNEYVRVDGVLVVDGGQLSFGKIESIRRTDRLTNFCFRRDAD